MTRQFIQNAWSGLYLGCVQVTLMKSLSNLRSRVGGLGPIIKCRFLEIFLISVVLWTLILLVFHSHGINTIPILLYGRD